MSSHPGLVGQSLCYALQEEMSDYYRLVAVLEAQMNEQQELHELQERQERRAQSRGGGGGSPLPPTTSTSLTLRRLWVWSQEPIARLRLMASMVRFFILCISFLMYFSINVLTTSTCADSLLEKSFFFF